MTVFELPKKAKRIAELEKQAADPGLWQDNRRAQQITKELADLKEEVFHWDKIGGKILELRQMEELAREDKALAVNLEKECAALEREFEKEEIKVFLSGKYDFANAVIMISAGAGGTEAQDWASMLLRMYQRYADREGFIYSVADISYGNEVGIKSVTLLIEGKNAYGLLRRESGVHRLVRQSPFNANNLRHTSFALVEVMPEIEESDAEIEIKPDEVEVETFRSSGPGGQNVNKVETAVRVKHLPTNITVACQVERSQLKNKERAFKMLKAKLYQLEEKKRAEELAKLKGESLPAEWGSQIRSYVLHPYKMVKDHRTDHETSQAQEVLDGYLEEFIESEIRKLK